jgi:hypothetical protein
MIRVVDVALVGVLGVVVGGVIGLAAQLLTSRIAVRQTWADTRRVVYSEFIEAISVARRQLDDEGRARVAGLPRANRAAVDPRALHLQAVAGWNRVRMITRSAALQDAARELTVRIQELRDLLESPTPPSAEALGPLLDAISLAYDRNRTSFMDEAQREIGLTRKS